MASGIVKDIDEKFCQCSICLEQFNEPKLLPCLHRFCKDCLAEVIQQNRGNVSCPVCRKECVIPKEGLDGFKTDFYMKNIIEYIQLQTTLDAEQNEDCCGCSKTLKVSAYCFKCNDFLCEACHQFHLTSKITKDHRSHTLAVEDLASKRLSLDKLASLKEAPSCHTHSEKLSELCCKTCNNTPICIACTYGNHKGHDFYEVTALANEERQKLEEKLAEVCSFEEGILQMPEKLDKIKSSITTVVSEKTIYIQSEYFSKKTCIKEKIQLSENESERSKKEKETALNEELKVVQSEMEKEITEIKLRYAKICDERRSKVNNELQNSQFQHNEEVSRLQKRLASLEIDYKMATTSLEKQKNENVEKVQTITEQIENTVKRFSNLKATASCILKTSNDWTAVQCIPDICKACNPLILEMGKQFPDLETLDQIEMKSVTFSNYDEHLHISDQTSVVDIPEIKDKGWNICDIKLGPNGKIVITGNAASGKSHITVIENTGKIIHQWKLSNSNSTWPNPDRFFDFLSQNCIVTICDPNEIGIFEIAFGIFKKKKTISKLTDNWPRERGVTCIATDHANKKIIVGSWESPLLCIFDDRLNLLRSLTLPVPMTGAADMLFHKQNLLVCCFFDSKAIVMTVDGSQGESVFEFLKPVDDGNDWNPLNACKDKNGFVYILWTDGTGIIGDQHIIAKYRPNGSHVLAIKEVDDNAFCLATRKFNNKEILIVATGTKGKLYQYDLVS